MTISQKSRAILQVLPAMGAGGVEQGTIDMAKMIVSQGDKAFVASGDGFRSKEISAVQGHHVILPLASKNPLRILFSNVCALKKLMMNEKIDLIHARSRGPAWSAYLAARSARVPFVTTFHGTYNFGGPLKKFYNSVMVRGVRVIAISDFIRDHILAHYATWVRPEQISVIHRGIDMERFNPEKISPQQINEQRTLWGVPEGVPLLLMPGRLTRWKGHENVLRAFANLESGQCVLVIVGHAQGREAYVRELKGLAQSLGVDAFVRFVPHSPDMPLLYAASHAVVHAATDPEAFGRVVAEAGAMGKPCIVSSLGAPREIIEEGVTGWCVDPFDQAALTQGMVRLLALDQEARDRIKVDARKRVEAHFSLEKMGTKTLELYHEILKGK